MQTHPLTGRRVIELGTMVAAPFAAHILSQLGAEVIKVEPAWGDPTRSLVRGGPSGTFIAYSHGKKSICFDLTNADGHAAFCKLLSTADAFLHNLAPKTVRRLRLTRQDCARIKPDLIYCHIRGYGPGPQEDDLASNPVAEAATGVMEANRINGRPSRLGPSYHDQFAGAYAVIGILASMLQPGEQERVVEVGLYETGLHVASRDLVGVQLKTQLLGRPEREPHGEFSMPGYGAYRTSDGRWVYLLMLTDNHWLRFCQAMQLPQADDQQLVTLKKRKKMRDQVEEIVKNAIGGYSFDDVVRRLQAVGMGFTEVLPLEQVLDAPQARQPGKLRTINYRGFEFAVPEFPRFGAAGGDPPTTPPPELGEHTIEVLQSIGMDAMQRDALLASGAVAAVKPDDFPWATVRKQS